MKGNTLAAAKQDNGIVVVFDVSGMNREQYDQVIKNLEAAGQEKPSGRLYDVASPTPGGWLVVDVWDSRGHLDAFARTLMPTLQKAGVPPPQPKICPVHNIIKG